MNSVKTPMQEPQIPKFCFQKIAIGLAGPFIESDSGNKNIFTIVDKLSAYIEAFPIPDKKASTIAHILINEIFNRYSWPLAIMSDNGSDLLITL